MGIHHSDVGGYLSLLCMVRTEELVLRWGEMNIFTPVLRTHEGNRPDRNWQVDACAYVRLTHHEIICVLTQNLFQTFFDNANFMNVSHISFVCLFVLSHKVNR